MTILFSLYGYFLTQHSFLIGGLLIYFDCFWPYIEWSFGLSRALGALFSYNTAFLLENSLFALAAFGPEVVELEAYYQSYGSLAIAHK